MDDFQVSFEKAEEFLGPDKVTDVRYAKMLLIKAQGFKRIKDTKAIEILQKALGILIGILGTDQNFLV